MSVVVQSYPFETPRSNKFRRDSKDSCFSEEMSDDLSATHIEDSYRLSPYATLSPISRKSSGGDSGVSIADTDDGISEGELSRENSFKKRDGSPVANGMNRHSSDSERRLNMLEEKLKQMEMLLRNETQKRQVLEKKVTRLEEENEKLVELRTKAATQLQTFSEKFFSMPEPKTLSPVTTPLPSPRNSCVELRRVGSNNSIHVAANRRSTSSLKSIKSRYSNISL